MRIPPFGVERWFVRYEFAVELNIAESCIQPFSVDELCRLCAVEPSHLLRQPVGYADGRGSADLREAIAALYPDTSSDEVLVTTGAIEANFLVAQALLEPSSRAIVEFPAYQQLYAVPRSIGARVDLWELHPEQAYRPDLAALERLAPAGEPLSMLTINHPHNPSGVRIDQETMAQIALLAASRGGVLHSDEVYRGLTLGDEVSPSPSAREITRDAVVVGSMSKAYGLSGARIGWIAGPRALIRRCSEIRDYISICPAFLSERLALLVLQHQDAVMARNKGIARRNSALLHEFLERNSDVLTCPLPDEGVIAFVRYHRPQGDGRAVPSSREFCARLAEERGVLLIPGDCFERDFFFRIGFGYESAVLKRGLEVFEQYCDEVLRA